jgi:hypothetical protein
MFIEKKLKQVLPRPLIADGSKYGLVRVADIRGFYVKQKITLVSPVAPPVELEVKRFESLTSFYVGPLPANGGKIGDRSDITAYKVADGAVIAAGEQDRPGIKPDEHERAVYMEEPIVAKRVISVDEYGSVYGKDNPIPVAVTDTAGFAPSDFDEVTITRDVEEYPTSYNFFKNSSPVGVIAVTYNQEKSAIKYKRTS